MSSYVPESDYDNNHNNNWHIGILPFPVFERYFLLAVLCNEVNSGYSHSVPRNYYQIHTIVKTKNPAISSDIHKYHKNKPVVCPNNDSAIHK